MLASAAQWRSQPCPGSSGRSKLPAYGATLRLHKQAASRTLMSAMSSPGRSNAPFDAAAYDAERLRLDEQVRDTGEISTTH